MANKMTDARRSLVRAKQAAQQRLDALEDEKAEIKGTLRCLEAALKALSKTKQPKATPKLADEDDAERHVRTEPDSGSEQIGHPRTDPESDSPGA